MSGGARIALLQMTSGIAPEVNAATLAEAAAGAAADGAAMLFTPEMTGLIDRDRRRAALSLRLEAEDVSLAAAREAAARHGLWIALGSLAVRREDGSLANRSFMIDARGCIVARYDKIHLFDVDLPSGERWRESEAYGGGDRAVLVDTPIGRIGLSICYDLRFPALYAALAGGGGDIGAGAQILAIPAAFTVPTGEAHWHVLLRARAIETGSFVVAAAQTGTHADGRSTYGHALVVDPWGRVLLDMGAEPGLGFADLDLRQVADARSRIPALAHRRAFLPPGPMAAGRPLQ